MSEEIGIETEEKPIVRDEKGLFQEGTAPGPGRPKGRFSITTQIIKFLEENPDKSKEIIEWLLENKKDLVWQMIDPKPPQDLNIGGQPDNPVRVIEIAIEDDNPV